MPPGPAVSTPHPHLGLPHTPAPHPARRRCERRSCCVHSDRKGARAASSVFPASALIFTRSNQVKTSSGGKSASKTHLAEEPWRGSNPDDVLHGEKGARSSWPSLHPQGARSFKPKTSGLGLSCIFGRSSTSDMGPWGSAGWDTRDLSRVERDLFARSGDFFFFSLQELEGLFGAGGAGRLSARCL